MKHTMVYVVKESEVTIMARNTTLNGNTVQDVKGKAKDVAQSTVATGQDVSSKAKDTVQTTAANVQDSVQSGLSKTQEGMLGGLGLAQEPLRRKQKKAA